jgi:formylglycine-generating enzyme required for sulfatase activity
MPTHQELPEFFGRYRILQRLGAGGMGAVYLAEDTRLRRKVALKVAHFTASTRAVGLERFQREARLAGSIEHPNFCPVHDVDEVDGVHFFTMAYLEGTLLSDLVADEQPWPPVQAVEMVRKVALAVGELHSRGIVHRDLKPANVMVRPSGEPVLMDFGLACSLISPSERLTVTGEVMGTPIYMSPEQLQGDRQQQGPPSDIYSLGMILYQLLTGQMPFVGTLAAVCAQSLYKLPGALSTLQPGLDTRLDAICLKALAKKPEDRFPDTSTFVAALDEFLGTPDQQEIQCPQCGQGLKIPASMVGKRLKCPQCGTLLATATRRQASPRFLPTQLETVPPSGQESAAHPPRQRARTGVRGPLVLVLLMVVGTAGWLGIHFRPQPEEERPDPRPPVEEVVPKKEATQPPRTASLRLEKLQPIQIKAGQRRTVRVKVRRENYSGPIHVVAEGAKATVKGQGQVDRDTEEGDLELEVGAGVPEGPCHVRLQALARAGAVSPAEGELLLTIQAASSLRLAEIAEQTVEAGKKITVSVKVQRVHCPGLVRLELVEPSPGVTDRNGQVREDKDEGSLELEVASDARPGERKLRLRAVADAAAIMGELRLTILPQPSLRLEDIALARVEAGQTKRVVVKVRRQRCPGPVEITQAGESSGVKVRNGLVGADSDEGSLEVEVDREAQPGKRTLRLLAEAGAAKSEGDLPLDILPVELADRFENTLKMRLVLIKKGEFLMGSPEGDKDKHSNEVAQHRVRIKKDFYMGATEVTVGQFKQFVEDTGYKTEAETDERGGWGYDAEAKSYEQKPIYNWQNLGWIQDDNHPVVNVTWNDAVAFCKWLSKKEGRDYDLPYEAEWEFACRAGTTTRYHGGDDAESLVKVGNVADASHKAKFPEVKTIKGYDGYVFTAPVGKFKPNAWGLYDMHGNAMEWCKDGRRKYPDKETAEKQKEPIEDYEGPLNVNSRVLRGGSWSGSPRNCRSASRVSHVPVYRHGYVGFRVVLRPGSRAP